MRGEQKMAVERLRRKMMRKVAALKSAPLTDNELAEQIRGTGDPFLVSMEWKALRRKVLEKHGAKCLCCGRIPKNPAHINVDHVKPRRFYPELALEESNLQVLCGRCNKRKGNKDTDYRPLPYL